MPLSSFDKSGIDDEGSRKALRTWALVANPSVWLASFLLSCKLPPEFIILQIQKESKKLNKFDLARRIWRVTIYFCSMGLAHSIKFVMRKRCPVALTSDINLDEQSNTMLQASKSDFCVVRGGKVIKAKLFSSFGGKWINIHGGVLPEYRGLDSHLWAASRQDWNCIGVTAHFMSEELDRGPIIFIVRLKNAERKGWLSLTIGIRRLENQVHRKIILELSSLRTLNDASVKKFEYYGRFPRRMNLIPILKR